MDLGLIGYDEAFAVQTAVHERRRCNKGPGTILFQENFHIITFGRWASAENLLVSHETLRLHGVALRNVSRGGDVTYHGPGQLVISPIIKLEEMALGVHRYVRLLEQVVIDLLAVYGIRGNRARGASGVWIGDRKIAAVGVAVKSGITQHGIAINVCPDLSYFDFIVPCGLRNRGVTSMEAQGGGVPCLQQVRDRFLREFSTRFEVEVGEGQLFTGRLKHAVRSEGAEICRGSKGNNAQAVALPER
jgi:lipoate-protein ligase B